MNDFESQEPSVDNRAPVPSESAPAVVRAPNTIWSPVISALRWIAVLPGALLAAWLTWVLVSLANNWGMARQGIDPSSALARVFTEGVSSGAMGAMLVYAGARIAPHHESVVVFVMAAVGVLVAGFSLFPAIMLGDGWAIYAGVAVAAGAGGVAWALYSGDLDPTELR